MNLIGGHIFHVSYTKMNWMVIEPGPGSGHKYLVINRQISRCTCPISHTAPFIPQTCIILLWMLHCEIWIRCIVGFVRSLYCVTAWNKVWSWITLKAIKLIEICTCVQCSHSHQHVMESLQYGLPIYGLGLQCMSRTGVVHCSGELVSVSCFRQPTYRCYSRFVRWTCSTTICTCPGNWQLCPIDTFSIKLNQGMNNHRIAIMA